MKPDPNNPDRVLMKDCLLYTSRKVSVNGTVSSYLRYMYRGYLQIAAIDAVSGVFLSLIHI